MEEKILHIIAQYPGKTGSGVFLQSLVNEGSKLNYKQGVVAATSKKLDKVEFKGEVDFYPVEFNCEKLNFNIVGMSDTMPYDSTKYSDLTEDMLNKWTKCFRETIKSAIEEFKPSVIITHHLFLLATIVNELRGNIKMIVLSQGTELRQIKKLPKYREIVIDGCKNVDLVCALNEYQKREIVNIYGIDEKKVKVMGVGYNSEVFFNKRDIKKLRRITYAGKISYSKGVKCLISAFKSIEDENLELFLAGSGSDEEKEIKEFAKNDSRIKFLGALEQNNLANIIRESEVFILPSFYEGLPLVIMEALACKTKVIMSNIKGVKPWVGDKINSSGVIEYIELPRMLEVDKPYEEDIKSYEESIKNCILKMLSRKVDFESILEEVESRSWESYFYNISKFFI